MGTWQTQTITLTCFDDCIYGPMDHINQSSNVVIVFFNPLSGASDRANSVDQLTRALKSRGMQVEKPADMAQLKELVTRLQAKACLRAVVAAGGDGTVGWLVNELPARIPIAILPLGTENLLAKYLGLSKSPETLAQLIEEGHLAAIDVGRANGTYFMVMASCGFDAEVVRRLHAVRDGHINHWSYAKPIINAIRQYDYPKIRIMVDGEEEPHIESRWAFIFNVPRYAMNLPIVDDADPTDGKLDLCTFRGGYLLLGLVYLGGIVMRQHRRWQDCRFEKFSRIRLESDGDVPYQLDGDPGGQLPLEIEIVPDYLRAIVSKKWLESHQEAKLEGSGLSAK